ncbi:response regulator [Horticoccus luteus]|uniref:Response regulator n=1 Tax=Horticoccus luteus TaxID=2862869 RepID=A0A8F9TUL0_9BACT|nr:response regulator [Horticoccus luteus]QYM78064.1 response regulator [Horticoccus luteus]
MVEDDPDAVFFIRRLLQKAGTNHPVEVMADGEEAIAFLEKSDAGRPLLVFLDLRLPRIDGFGVLKWIRQRPEFTDMLTVILSTSDENSDVKRAYELGADGYLPKFPTSAEVRAVVDAAHEAAEERPTLPGLTRPRRE